MGKWFHFRFQWDSTTFLKLVQPVLTFDARLVVILSSPASWVPALWLRESMFLTDRILTMRVVEYRTHQWSRTRRGWNSVLKRREFLSLSFHIWTDVINHKEAASVYSSARTRWRLQLVVPQRDDVNPSPSPPCLSDLNPLNRIFLHSLPLLLPVYFATSRPKDY